MIHKKYQYKILKVILAIILTVSLFETKGQDIHFTQYNANLLSINPAFAGLELNSIRAQLSFKNQWTHYENPYNTYGFSVDGGFLESKNKNGFWGSGINLFHDISGVTKLSSTYVNITGAYHVKLDNQNWLIAGLQGGLIQRKIDYGNQTWDKQFDGIDFNLSYPTGENPIKDQYIVGDLSTGLLWRFRSKNVIDYIGTEGITSEVGVAVFHANKPQFSLLSSNVESYFTKYVLHSRMSFGIPNESFAIIPNVVFSKQNVYTELLVGTLFKVIINQDLSNRLNYFAILFGLQYRTKDSFAPNLIFEWKNLELGISYDFDGSPQNNTVKKKIGLEISIRYFVQFSPKLVKNSKSLL